MTQDDAIWLLEVYQPKKGFRISDDTMQNYFIPARRILSKDPTIGMPSCGCQFRTFVQITNSMFDQYKEEIIKEAYPKLPLPTKKGRPRGK